MSEPRVETQLPSDEAALRCGDGAELLDAVREYLCRFVAYPSADAATAHALWVAHTHLMHVWESTPRIAFLSPEPGSGKTRAIELTETLVPRPVASVNATPAYLFRKVSDPEGLPTILYDEVDTLFGPRAKDNEEVRGMINAGHRRGATAGRCVIKGKVIETEELPAYCAVALAGIGNLPDTILTRSIVIRMRRRSPANLSNRIGGRIHAPEGNALRDRLAVWAKAVGRPPFPPMPEGIVDRDADVLGKPMAIAHSIGGEWPRRANCSAVALVALAKSASPSLGVLLLSDLWTIFRDREAMWTAEILTALIALEESPWGDIKGKSLTDRGLAGLLKQYGVASKDVRVGVIVNKGYSAKDLHDPWLRYLGVPAKGGATSATALQDDLEPNADLYRAASRGE